MARMPRLLRREAQVDPAELELARAVSLERLQQMVAQREASRGGPEAPRGDAASPEPAADAAEATADSKGSPPPIVVEGIGESEPDPDPWAEAVAIPVGDDDIELVGVMDAAAMGAAVGVQSDADVVIALGAGADTIPDVIELPSAIGGGLDAAPAVALIDAPEVDGSPAQGDAVADAGDGQGAAAVIDRPPEVLEPEAVEPEPEAPESVVEPEPPEPAESVAEPEPVEPEVIESVAEPEPVEPEVIESVAQPERDERRRPLVAQDLPEVMAVPDTSERWYSPDLSDVELHRGSTAIVEPALASAASDGATNGHLAEEIEPGVATADEGLEAPTETAIDATFEEPAEASIDVLSEPTTEERLGAEFESESPAEVSDDATFESPVDAPEAELEPLVDVARAESGTSVDAVAPLEPEAIEPEAIDADLESAEAGLTDTADLAEPEPERVERPVDAEPVETPTDAVALASVAATPDPKPARPKAKPKAAKQARPKPHKAAKSVQAAPVADSAPFASCPYCAHLLVPPPTTNKRCPRCQQKVIVRRVEGRVAYLTEASLTYFDAERALAGNRKRWAKERDQWARLALAAGAPREKVTRLTAPPASERAVDATRNLYLTTVDRTIRAARAEGRWPDAVQARRTQALALHKLSRSVIPPSDIVIALWRDAAIIELRGIGELARVAELVGAACCDACQADDGTLFRIADELREPRIPHPTCPRGLCGCHWRLSDRDRQHVARLLKLNSRG